MLQLPQKLKIIALAACVFLVDICHAQSGSALTSAAAAPGDPVLFVIDASRALDSFDADGHHLQTQPFYPEVCTPTGGMAMAMGKIYVTCAPGGEGGGVFAFNAMTLHQVRLHIGAFTAGASEHAKGAISAITYDWHRDRFYVGSDGLGLLVFNDAGGYMPEALPVPVSVSAIADDRRYHSIWGIAAHRGLVRFDGQSDTPLATVPVGRGWHVQGRDPVGVSVCLAAESDVNATSTLVIASQLPGRRGGMAVQKINPDGLVLGPSFSAKVVNFRGISCSPRGEVYLAADDGLHSYTLKDGAPLLLRNDLAALSAPVYGVLAADVH